MCLPVHSFYPSVQFIYWGLFLRPMKQAIQAPHITYFMLYFPEQLFLIHGCLPSVLFFAIPRSASTYISSRTPGGTEVPCGSKHGQYHLKLAAMGSYIFYILPSATSLSPLGPYTVSRVRDLLCGPSTVIKLIDHLEHCRFYCPYLGHYFHVIQFRSAHLGSVHHLAKFTHHFILIYVQRPSLAS